MKLDNFDILYFSMKKYYSTEDIYTSIKSGRFIISIHKSVISNNLLNLLRAFGYTIAGSGPPTSRYYISIPHTYEELPKIILAKDFNVPSRIR